jgi:hypothetical protein
VQLAMSAKGQKRTSRAPRVQRGALRLSGDHRF